MVVVVGGTTVVMVVVVSVVVVEVEVEVEVVAVVVPVDVVAVDVGDVTVTVTVDVQMIVTVPACGVAVPALASAAVQYPAIPSIVPASSAAARRRVEPAVLERDTGDEYDTG